MINYANSKPESEFFIFMTIIIWLNILQSGTFIFNESYGQNNIEVSKKVLKSKIKFYKYLVFLKYGHQSANT